MKRHAIGVSRMVVIISLPPAVVWAFVSTLVCETGSAVHYAWLAVMENVEAAAEAWHHGIPKD